MALIKSSSRALEIPFREPFIMALEMKNSYVNIFKAQRALGQPHIFIHCKLRSDKSLYM